MMSDQGSKEKWKRGNQFQGEDQDDQQHRGSQQGEGDRNFQDGYAGHDSQDGHGGGGERSFQDKTGRYERLDTRMCKDTPVEKDDINCGRATEKMCESNNVSNQSEINKTEMQKREDDSERIESSSLIEQSGEEEGREVEDCKKGKRRICNNKESSQKIVTSMKWLRQGGGVISICGNNKTNKSKCKKMS